MIHQGTENGGSAQDFLQAAGKGGSTSMKLAITLVGGLFIAQLAWAMSTIQSLTTQTESNSRKIEFMSENITHLRVELEKVKDLLDKVRYSQQKP